MWLVRCLDKILLITFVSDNFTDVLNLHFIHQHRVFAINVDERHYSSHTAKWTARKNWLNAHSSVHIVFFTKHNIFKSTLVWTNTYSSETVYLYSNVYYTVRFVHSPLRWNTQEFKKAIVGFKQLENQSRRNKKGLENITYKWNQNRISCEWINSIARRGKEKTWKSIYTTNAKSSYGSKI